jgi:hypothetical protein
MHLAVESAQGTIRVESGSCVVVHAGRASLEQRRNKYDAKLLGKRGKPDGDRARNGLCQIEQAGIFALAEILGLEELWQADDLRSPRGGLMDLVDGPLQILVGIGRRRHLHQSDLELLRQAEASLKRK